MNKCQEPLASIIGVMTQVRCRTQPWLWLWWRKKFKLGDRGHRRSYRRRQ